MTKEKFYLNNNHEQVVNEAEYAFARFFHDWRDQLPLSCEIEHVGATSVQGCLTKGDLDVCIRVEQYEFEHADIRLAGKLNRNTGSIKTDFFSAFAMDHFHPPLGVQLVVKGSDLDIFVTFRDRMRESPTLVHAYNQMKRQFNGCDMEEYRQAKAEFVNAVLS